MKGSIVMREAVRCAALWGLSLGGCCELLAAMPAARVRRPRAALRRLRIAPRRRPRSIEV